MDRGNALRYFVYLLEYESFLEKRSDIAAVIEHWEAFNRREWLDTEEEWLAAAKEYIEAKKESLMKEMEDDGSVLVYDASQIDAVESLIKDHKLVCDFYTADPEIMEEMRRRGLPIYTW